MNTAIQLGPNTLYIGQDGYALRYGDAFVVTTGDCQHPIPIRRYRAIDGVVRSTRAQHASGSEGAVLVSNAIGK